MNTLVISLALTIAALVLALVIAIRVAISLYMRMEELRSSNQSLSTRYGQVAEQFLPFTENYPYNPGNFRFIGSPVDGIQFEDDRVVIMEFKTGKSKLTGRQRQIRDLVEAGKVEFHEIRV